MADKKKMRSEASSSRGSTSSSSGIGNINSSTIYNRGESEVVDVGGRRSSCGYCRSPGHTSISHGLWAHSLTVDDYEALLDRGWRRSGCFLYKPEMDRTCCPSYTIRLKASDFVPSKEQQRVSKRMQRFLDGELEVKKTNKFMDGLSTSNDSCSLVHTEATGSAVKEPLEFNVGEKDKAEQIMHYLSDQIDNAVNTCIERGDFPRNIQLPKTSVKKVAQGKRKLQVEGSEDLLYSSNISFQIAAALRRGNKVHHIEVSGGHKEENEHYAELTPKVIADKLASYLNHLSELTPVVIADKLSVRACNGHINIYSTTSQACSDKVVERVMDHKESCTESADKRSLKKSTERLLGKRQRLEVILKRSSFDPEEYDLYRRYQIKVHNDTPDHVSENSYRRFLVETPLVFVPSNGDDTIPPCGFGSFHQQYIIDGRLVAVGVMDILPKCLSSKYLFWDPDLAFLSLGKYSALQEICWVRENQAHCPSLQYYYLGYYIHSCNKMRYKAAYHPSELLCPLRYQWVPFDTAKPLLDRKPYVILSDFPNLQAEDSSKPLIEFQMDLQHEESNDVPFDEDEEMSEIDFEDSDDESGPETSVLASAEIEDASVGNIMIGLKGSRLRYKDIQQAFGPAERRCMETKLYRYMKAVGATLSERMVFSLG